MGHMQSDQDRMRCDDWEQDVRNRASRKFTVLQFTCMRTRKLRIQFMGLVDGLHGDVCRWDA